jgi:Bacterial PH domain/Short C-terminal domain
MPFGFGNRKKDTTGLTRNISPKEQAQIHKIIEILNPDEKILLVARQSRIRPGGSCLTPNTVYATDRRIIIRDPYMLGIKENIVDIPYDIITSVKLEKGLLSSTIRFKAPGLVSSTRLGMMEEIIDGQEEEHGGKIEAITKKRAEELIQIIRSGMQGNKKSPSSILTRRGQTSPSSSSRIAPVENPFAFTLSSVADELAKFAKLREQGIITEEEFLQTKRDLINGIKERTQSQADA